ncbi:hypothetical protein PTSG_11211 [Salpingoeca rosetta]|uniref:Uncharacterized protein n=1 Tax=Salpingoeca rosetta (strain ATCC 50818 / BSB-021) TaxID=946362 RepID=F2USR2_SALR5|nr:uncharacterized protein PTSG_11211 [Salpingoeca rosetta]EGD81171.1 hypothetical protein PTSG_11211 [Salpingoeca rosetta]|eukprot:XP_004987856.1 hypothetical protein PTSG_11211 [Salpingoeca rosetta]
MPDAAAATFPIQLSLLERLPEDRWRMMGGAHMMDWEEQLWTHTSMVMVGTSNHSDAVMRSSAISAIAIDRTAAITLRPTPAPIWREADIAHVSRSHEEAPPRHVPVQGLAHQLRHAAGVQQRGRAGSASTTPGPKHAGQDIAVPDPRQPSSRPHETRQPRADTIVLENATTTTNVHDLTTFTPPWPVAVVLLLVGDLLLFLPLVRVRPVSVRGQSHVRQVNKRERPEKRLHVHGCTGHPAHPPQSWLLGDPSTLYAHAADARVPTCGGTALPLPLPFKSSALLSVLQSTPPLCVTTVCMSVLAASG